MYLALALTLLTPGSPYLAEAEGLAAAPERLFVPNEGQWDARALGRLRLGGATAWLVGGGWTLDLHGCDAGVVLDFRLEGSTEETSCSFEERETPVQNYLLGNDRERWRSGVETFRRARISAVRSGVDLVLRTEGAMLEYDLELSAGVDVAELAIRVAGADGLELTTDGRLLVHTKLGAIQQQPPRTWSTNEAGARRLLPCRFSLLDSRRFGFEVDGWDGTEPLTIDPGLDWSSFLGGSDTDLPADLAVDSLGRTIVVGSTSSFDFPASPGAYDLQLDGTGDVFVTCFAEDGSGYVWSTFLGGSDSESAAALHLAVDREITLAGETRSADFPISPTAFDTSHNGFSDVFVSRLSRDGTDLLASTFFGGAGSDITGGLDRGANGETVVAGTTNNGTLPTTSGALQTQFQGGPFSGSDAFVARFDSDLTQLLWSTFLGGTGSDIAEDVSLTSQGNVQVCGRTGSANFPTAAAFDSTLAGPSDGFVCELVAVGNFLNWSTLLGGSGADTISSFQATGGQIVVGGTTDSMDFPVSTGALQTTIGGAKDAFVGSFSSSASVLDWATFLGHELDDELADLSLDSTGRPVAVGSTASRFFPATPWGFQAWFRGPYTPGAVGGDGWLVRLAAGGSQLDYGSFVGGAFDDAAIALEITAGDQCHLVGRTLSSSFPTSPGAVDPLFDFSGLGDGFVLSLDFAHYPFVFGTSKLTSGFFEPYLGWNGFPSLGGSGFSITIDDAWPSGGMGTLLVSETRVDIPQVGGARYVGAPSRRAATTSLGFFGSGSMEIPISPWMVGKTLYFQFVFQDSNASFGLGLSNGMAVTFHP